MGTINERISKKGIKTWQVIIRRAGEPTIVSTFKDRREAEMFDREVAARLAKAFAAKSPSLDLPASGNLNDEKLMDTFAMFTASDAYTTRHSKCMPTIVRNIGDTTIGDLKPSWATAYVAKMRKLVTRRKSFFGYESIVDQLNMINLVLKWRADQLDMRAPKLRFDTKKFPKGWAVKRSRRLEKGEEEALLARLSTIGSTAGRHWPLLVTLAIETGTRLQELILAEWGEISEAVDFWTIPKMHTKSKKERVIPLTSGAITALNKLREISTPDNPRIFHPLGNTRSVSAFFHKMSLQAGLVDFRFHDLRHEGISRFVLTQRNFSVYEIMQMVGHSSPAMLQRYSNLRGDELSKKIIRTPVPAQFVAAPPLREPTSPWGATPFGFNFEVLRAQASPRKLPAPIFGVMKGFDAAYPSVYPQLPPPTP